MVDKILIAGVGNPYRRDDGSGPAIIKILQTQELPHLALLDALTDGFLLLEQLSLYAQTLIIDAVTMGEVPGTVKIFSPAEVLLHVTEDALSTHGFGLAETLKLMEQLKIQTNCKILGVEPYDVHYGEGLSDVVRNAIPQIVATVINFGNIVDDNKEKSKI